ncbi:MAG TPA: DUF6159 family protein [Puia sp.]|nr:DUF6159 family protein [Puia sp.]
MSFFEKLSNGWRISLYSFSVLRENKSLIIFPILSAVSMILIFGSVITAVLASNGWTAANFDVNNRTLDYILVFLFYLVNYFIVVFFNMALIHCTRLYFHGQRPKVADGIRFSLSRVRSIFAWAVLAAIVGTILRIIQENVGSLGKIITGLIGVVWNIAAFFVVPVIAYENLGPVDAIKRSASMMKQKWGESLGATFSFGLIHFIAVLVVAGSLFVMGSFINVVLGIALAVLGVLVLAAIFSAAQTIFVSSVYHEVTGDPVAKFNEAFADSLFVSKKS